MLSSISNNKTISKDGEVWLDAILKRDISKVSKDNIDTFRMFNKSKLTDGSVVRKSTKETAMQKVSSSIVDSMYDTIGTTVNKLNSFYRFITYAEDGQVIIIFNF